MICAVFNLFTFFTSLYATPSEYTELQYIESSGTQYIDTGVNASNRAVFSLSATPETTEMVKYVVANVDSTEYLNGFGQYYNYVAGANGAVADMTDRHNYDISYSDSGITLIYDGKPVTNTNLQNYRIYNNKKISLLGSAVIYRRIKAKLYSIKLYNNDNVVFDGIPARRKSDNVIGLYDTVTNTFFTNAGTGIFVAGPDVPKIVTTSYVQGFYDEINSTKQDRLESGVNVITTGAPDGMVVSVTADHGIVHVHKEEIQIPVGSVENPTNWLPIWVE